MSKLSSRALGVLARYTKKNERNGTLKNTEKHYCITKKDSCATITPEKPVFNEAQETKVITNPTPLATREHGGYRLTEEQNVAVDLAETTKDLKIEAYAGAGKTSTLSAISTALSKKRGLYIAFNKTIADEAAQKFPNNVDCRTAHSLAYRAIGYQYKDRLGRLSGGYLAEKYLKLNQSIYGLTPATIGNLVIDTINRFVQSVDHEITKDHAPWVTLRAIEDKDIKKEVASYAVSYAKKTWQWMGSLKSDIPITHDVYLKLWTMTGPDISKDFILFDETQDASPVMLDLVCSQQAQKIFVGDRYQQIYSWRGAVNAMQNIDTKHSCKISQSFRFGQPIADIANTILNENLDANVNIRGFDAISSKIAYDRSPTAILCRTNSCLINTLINRLGNGEKIAVSGGCKDTIFLLKAAEELMDSGSTNHKDLMLFKSWEEVIDFSETDSGSDLVPLVRLVDDYDIDELISALQKTDRIREKDADLVLSTAHKSKGREWKSVRLEDDFRHQGSKGYSEEESNILYVAATRAINNLDIRDCEAIQEIL